MIGGQQEAKGYRGKPNRDNVTTRTATATTRGERLSSV